MILYQNVDDSGFQSISIAYGDIDNIIWTSKSDNPQDALSETLAELVKMRSLINDLLSQSDINQYE